MRLFISAFVMPYLSSRPLRLCERQKDDRIKIIFLSWLEKTAHFARLHKVAYEKEDKDYLQVFRERLGDYKELFSFVEHDPRFQRLVADK